MKLTILGTGTFFADKDHSGPAYLLEADKKKILIDCGPGTLIQLSKLGIKPEAINYIFISHFHADHTTDLFALLNQLRLMDFFGTKKIKKYPVVYGPIGIDKFIHKLEKVYQLPAFTGFNKIKFKELSKCKLGNIKVQSFSVNHVAFGIPAKANSLRFTMGSKIFAYSGDSVKCKGLEDAAKNSDIFVCDASYSKGKGSRAHLDTYEIGEISEKNSVKKVILTHFYPICYKKDLVSEVKEKYSGKVVRGKDLMQIKI